MSSPDHLDIFCFFFYGYADHVDLHSFPTRCSSDLGAHGGYHLARPAEEIAMDEVVLALEGSVAPMDCFVTLPTERVADRKSTRLNSSHVSISYAVFCLKKKKNKHNAISSYYYA